ncbi:hypothetical protein HF086_007250 [Spodoptera exigua]|uniref:Uncharacterized protein n=1 Tax=Spodoptera exigua TaxID=7107 RepID=A0A922MPS6_SPOEX|nr:hypothetical protein HF086_007250 [Spodoptera exigua]
MIVIWIRLNLLDNSDSVDNHATVLNIVILVLYRTGYNGEFLGVGGTWNLNEEKNPDAEIVASGVIVGYLIYTLVQMITFLFGTTEHKRAMSEIVMNFVGVFMWIAVGAVALHYWGGLYVFEGSQDHEISTASIA